MPIAGIYAWYMNRHPGDFLPFTRSTRMWGVNAQRGVLYEN